MKSVNLSVAKARLGRILSDVKNGETYEICLRNKPVAVIQPIHNEQEKPVKRGVLKGKFVVPDNFDEQLAEFENYPVKLLTE